MTFDKEYFSGKTSPIDYDSLSYQVTLGLRFRTLLGLLRKHGRHEGVLVDVGCALGHVAARFAKAGFRTLGCDVSRWAIVEAKRRHPNVTFLRADAGALPFQAAAFNVVTLLETLEHCEEPRRILEEVRRLLAPAGVAIISVPTTDLNDTRADKTHRWHLSMEAWRDMFAKELRVVEVKYFLKRLRYFDRRVANTFFVLTV